MIIAFLTLVRVSNVEERGIYHDLMRKFRDEGHSVYIVTAAERRLRQETSLAESHGVKILNVKTLNIQKTNIVEKGIGTLLIESQFKSAIKKYLGDITFDLITYSTPPITFTSVVKYLKKKNPDAISYLQLKDIFPQNAVDIGMFGEKSIFNWFFRKKEQSLYRTSDYIGCMSPANVAFVLKHNPEISPERVEVAPNSVELKVLEPEPTQEKAEYCSIRKKYNLPIDKPIFIYGGNLGRPQGVDYLVKCLDASKERNDCFFVVVGSGTHYGLISEWYEKNKGKNALLLSYLPKSDYDSLVRNCDVGMIFLDHRFTIPNYPSRLLTYLENKIPIICATDPNTDIGRIAEENGYGYWCESSNPEDFASLVDKMLSSDRRTMGEKGYKYMESHYLVENTYSTIMAHFAE